MALVIFLEISGSWEIINRTSCFFSGTDGYFWNAAEHWAQSEGMHSWVASICIMRCYLLVFQRSTAFHLWSHTTGFHRTKQLNTTANSSFRTRLKDTAPKQCFCFYLIRHTLSTLLSQLYWCQHLKGPRSLGRAYWKDRYRAKVHWWRVEELEYGISEIVRRQGARYSGETHE